MPHSHTPSRLPVPPRAHAPAEPLYAPPPSFALRPAGPPSFAPRTVVNTTRHSEPVTVGRRLDDGGSGAPRGPGKSGGSGGPRRSGNPPRGRGRIVLVLRGVVGLVLVTLVALGLVWAYGELFRPGPDVGFDPADLPQGLEPRVQDRFDAAARAAGADGVALSINSGWRSAQSQEELFDEAIVTHGSAREAARWVLPPERSAHVWGTAIDVTPATGAAWLAARDGEFGLCRVYENEPWHFEPLVEPGGTCPAVVADASVR